MRNHIKRDHLIPEGQKKCLECEKNYSLETFESHNCPAAYCYKVRKCQQCNYIVKSKSDLKEHQKNEHLTDTILFIGAIYKSEVYLSRYSDDYFHIIFQFVTNTLIITTVIITNFHLNFDSKHLLVT